MSVLVIAEPGSTHEGDRQTMYRLINHAKWAGADVVKFQWTSDPLRLAARRHAEEYVDAYRLIAFPRDWHAELAAYSQRAGIEYACTVYLPEDIAVVAPFVKRFKIASFEAQDHEFVLAHVPYCREGRAAPALLISTGAMDEAAVVALLLDGRLWCSEQLSPCLLHCVSAYPAPPEDMNLALLDHYDGLSDHSMSPLVAAMAVARGAQVIEAHLRLDSTPATNPDFAHSMPPYDFWEYVRTIRQAERIMGDGVKRVMPSEARWAKYSVKA